MCIRDRCATVADQNPRYRVALMIRNSLPIPQHKLHGWIADGTQHSLQQQLIRRKHHIAQRSALLTVRFSGWCRVIDPAAYRFSRCPSLLLSHAISPRNHVVMLPSDNSAMTRLHTSAGSLLYLFNQKALTFLVEQIE